MIYYLANQLVQMLYDKRNTYKYINDCIYYCLIPWNVLSQIVNLGYNQISIQSLDQIMSVWREDKDFLDFLVELRVLVKKMNIGEVAYIMKLSIESHGQVSHGQGYCMEKANPPYTINFSPITLKPHLQEFITVRNKKLTLPNIPYENELQIVKKELDSTKLSETNLKIQLDKNNNKIAELEKKNQDNFRLSETISKLEENNEGLTKENLRLSETIYKLENKNEDLTKENLRLYETLLKLEKNNEDLNQEIQTLKFKVDKTDMLASNISLVLDMLRSNQNNNNLFRDILESSATINHSNSVNDDNLSVITMDDFISVAD